MTKYWVITKYKGKDEFGMHPELNKERAKRSALYFRKKFGIYATILSPTQAQALKQYKHVSIFAIERVRKQWR